VIEDFFRLLIDALIYYPYQVIPSTVSAPIFSAALTALTLQQEAPLTATLHYLRDILSYGTLNPSNSAFESENRQTSTNPPEIQATVKQLVLSQGEVLIQRILTGMMFSFPRDCFPDASGVLLVLFELMPQDVAVWVRGTVGMLPTGTVKPGEADRLMNGISDKVQKGEIRKVRTLLQGKLRHSLWKVSLARWI